jgi:hypothetical protein
MNGRTTEKSLTIVFRVAAVYNVCWGAVVVFPNLLSTAPFLQSFSTEDIHLGVRASCIFFSNCYASEAAGVLGNRAIRALHSFSGSAIPFVPPPDANCRQ